MVIHDFHIVGIPLMPYKTHPPLIVDTAITPIQSACDRLSAFSACPEFPAAPSPVWTTPLAPSLPAHPATGRSRVRGCPADTGCIHRCRPARAAVRHSLWTTAVSMDHQSHPYRP